MRTRVVAVASVAAFLLIAPVAVAQSPPAPSPPGPANPSAPSTAVPPTIAPPGPPAVVPTTAPLPDAPPIGDGAEIPEAPAPTEAPGQVFGPVLGVPPTAGGASLDAARAAIAEQIAERGDALAVARDLQTELTAQLDGADSALATAQTDLDREMQRREDAESTAKIAEADAEEALDEAGEARRELRDLAVVMYVDPPQQLQVAAALNGGMSERLAAESLLAAKSDLSQRAAARTERAEHRADRLARSAD